MNVKIQQFQNEVIQNRWETWKWGRLGPLRQDLPPPPPKKKRSAGSAYVQERCDLAELHVFPVLSVESTVGAGVCDKWLAQPLSKIRWVCGICL